MYYSRTGTTRTVAEAIRSQTGWDVDPIVDTRDRSGIRGYARSLLDSILARNTRLKPPQRSPGDYDLVVIGTPVWGGKVSTPVRSYLAEHADELRDVALFATCGGAGSDRVLREMAHLAGKRPLATMAAREVDVKRGNHIAAVTELVDEIARKREPASPRPVETPPPPA